MTKDFNVSVSMNQAAPVKTGVVLKQGDFGFDLKITVLDFTVTGTTPQIVFRKPMGSVESTDVTASGNVYTYTFKGTELDTPGKVFCDLKLKNSTTQRISTASFQFECIADTLDGLTEESSSYSDTIAQIVSGFDDDLAILKKYDTDTFGDKPITGESIKDGYYFGYTHGDRTGSAFEKVTFNTVWGYIYGIEATVVEALPLLKLSNVYYPTEPRSESTSDKERLRTFIVGDGNTASINVVKSDGYKITEYIQPVRELANNLTTTTTGKALDATQGKALKDITDGQNAAISSIRNTTKDIFGDKPITGESIKDGYYFGYTHGDRTNSGYEKVTFNTVWGYIYGIEATTTEALPLLKLSNVYYPTEPRSESTSNQETLKTFIVGDGNTVSINVVKTKGYKIIEYIPPVSVITNLLNKTLIETIVLSSIENFDCNSLARNTAYIIGLGGTTAATNHVPVDGFNGNILTLGRSDIVTFASQIAMARDAKLYVRYYYTEWSAWREFANTSSISSLQSQIDNINLDNLPNLYAAFKTIGVIGDSLASGECYPAEGGTGTDFYDISWLQYMCRAEGITGYNFSRGGLTTRSWLTDGRGYTMASQSDKICKAYIIGLGQNDVNQSIPIGTIEDIDDEDYTQNEDTYYGNYGGIIQRMKEIQPDAKFFLVTDPLGADSQTRANYNVAVRAICQHFTNCYLVDLEADSAEFLDTDSYIYKNKVAAHYTAASYKYISEIMARYINAIMYNNPDEFKFIQYIGI